jgi:arsenate reductase
LAGGEVRVTMYGIRNCDTVKKARAWLDRQGIEYHFHDYKAAGIDRERLEGWCRKLGWETLLNRAGTTFRKLPDADRQAIDARKAVKLMLAQPSMIKRPVLEVRDRLLAGFRPEAYEAAFRGRQ